MSSKADRRLLTPWLMTAVVLSADSAWSQTSSATSSQASKEISPTIPEVLHSEYGKRMSVKLEGASDPVEAAWAERAKEMVLLWYPIIATYLATPGWQGATEIVLEFQDIDGVAHAAGNRITISTRWIKSHPQDIGMVLHELVHVIQQYPPQPQHGWLIEGIADYIRFWHAEPSGKPKILRSKNHYRQGYRVTAAFLAWIQEEHLPLVIQELNLLLRKGSYADDWFEKRTGKNLDSLWNEFLNDIDATR